MHPPTHQVRVEGPDDAAAIRHVHDAAFGGLTEGRIVDDLRGTDDWIPSGSVMAQDADGTILGHVLLSRGRLVQTGAASVELGIIGPVGVLPERQREGVGTTLMRRAIEVATELRLPVICLVGHAEYYPRFGFEPARHLGLEPPHPWPDANWMALRLPGWTPTLRGTVRFPPAFPDA